VLVVFNLAGAAVDIRLPAALGQPRPLDGHGLLQGHFDGGQLRLPGYGAWFASVE
jgi:alpha-glucosidase